MSLPDDDLPPLPMVPLPMVPLPVLPLPVEPFDPIQSAWQPPRARRPGIINFIAITSIIVGSLSILASAGFAFMDFGLVLSSNIPTPAPVGATVVPMVATPLTPIAVVTHGTIERVPFSGLAYSDRQMFEMGLQHVRPLSAEQLEQLDEMLAENGKAITGNASVPQPDEFSSTVVSSGHHRVGDTPGSDYFVMSTGRLELSADRAVFFPTAGQPSIRSMAVALPTPVGTPDPKALLPFQIRSIVRTVNELNGPKIKSAQVKTLVGELQSPGQHLVMPTTDGTDPAYEVTAASTDGDGILRVTTQHGTTSDTFRCDASGAIVDTAVLSATTSTTYTATGPKVNKTAGIAAMSLSAAQVLPGIFLLVIGIMTLRFSPRGRLLHWIYVLLKLPLGVATAAVSYWMWSGMIQASITSGPGAMSAGAAAAPSAVTGLMLGLAPAALGCLWPIVLIFVLSSKTTRLYYTGGASA